MVTGANGQLGSELQNLSVNYPAYNFLFTTKKELSIENEEALNTFFENHSIHIALIVLPIQQLIKLNQKKKKHFL